MDVKKIIKILSCLLILSCESKGSQEFKSWTEVSEKLKFQEQKEQILVKSGRFDYQFPKNKIPFKRVMVLNTSLLGYISELNQEDKIIGMAGTRYVSSQRVRDLIKSGKIQEVGSEQKYNVEKILSLKPDAIFTNYISSFENIYDILRKNGIEIIFLDEYLEQKPLEKSAYLKLFGKLLGAENEAEKIYTEIENNYQNLKQKISKIEKKSKVLTSEMYGNHWYVAGSDTFVANYLKDSGADYVFRDVEGDKAVPKSFEEVFVRGQDAEYWVNVGNYQNKSELLVMNAAYQKLPVFQQGKIYTMTKRQHGDGNDFFERGSVRVDWVLKDYIKIFHPEVLPQDTLMFMKELK